MLALYTEDQLGAAYQIYARTHAARGLDIVEFDTYREIFETKYVAMSEPHKIFDGKENTH